MKQSNSLSKPGKDTSTKETSTVTLMNKDARLFNKTLASWIQKRVKILDITTKWTSSKRAKLIQHT